MSHTIPDIIKITAEAIQNGIKPYKLIADPTKILSKETKQIVIAKKGSGVRLSEEIIDQLIADGESIDKDALTWKHYLDIPQSPRYVVFPDRENKTLIKKILLEIIPDLRIVNVPVEDWSWDISTTDGPFAQEFISYFI